MQAADEDGRGILRLLGLGDEARDAFARPEPERARTVAEGGHDLALDKAVGGAEVLDAPALWVEPVNAPRRPDVDAAPLVLGEAAELIAGERAGGRERCDARVFRFGLFEPHAAAAGGDPETARAVEIESLPEASGHFLLRAEQLEAPVSAASRQPAVVQADPEIPAAVFAEDVRPVEAGQPVRFSIPLKVAGRALPTREHQRRIVRADPDVAARVLEEARDVVVGQSLARRVDGEGRRGRQLFESPHGGEAVETLARGRPPFARVILNDVPAAQAGFDDALGQVEAHGVEPLAVEPAHRPLRADDAEAALRPLEE